MKRSLISLAIGVALIASLASSVEASSLDDSLRHRDRVCQGFGSGDGAHDDAPDRRYAARHLVRRCLRLNQIQVIGTHNSYKEPVSPFVLGAIAAFSPELAASIEYSHSPLAEQFSDEEVRQIEIDVYADPQGGHLAGRPVLDFLGLPNETPPELLEPGFKVLHINDLDFNSSCLTLTDCLQQLRQWSRHNRGHLPITVLIELKTDPIPDPLGIGFITPLPIGPAELDALDDEIRSVLSDRHLIEPEEVRGRFDTLEDAVLAGNWPTLHKASGKFMFAMINDGQARDDYLDGHPSLDGRVMFTNSTPGNADAAFLKVDDAITNGDEIRALVAAGYVVRTRADIPTIEARTGDTTRFDAALASGAQWISTDYPVPGRAFVDYSAQIPDGEPARCNPINTGPRCVNAELERLRSRYYR